MSGPATDWAGFAAHLAAPVALSAVGIGRATGAFVDTVACIVAGAASPAARAAAGQHAVFRWAVAGHALDYDDYDRPSVAHPSTVLVPVALAMADRGPTAIAAYVAGLEAMDGIGIMVNPVHYDRGWHATGTLGTIGAAVTAARCLGLGAAHMGHAMAIATAAAAGLKAQFGSLGKPMGAGFAALNGLLAAQLAAQGADGRAAALDAFVALTGPDQPRPLTFGARPAIEEFGLVAKAHPCCGYLGRLVPAALALARSLRADEIAEIRLCLPPRSARVLSYGIPRSEDEARFSAPYCLAVAFVTGRLGLDDFTPAALQRPEVLDLAARVQIAEAPTHVSEDDLSPEDPDILQVLYRDGRPATTCVLADLPGSPELPMPAEALLAKVEDCGASAALPLLERLQTLPDMTPLRRLIEELT